jgi:hypothetical protein
MEDAAAACSHTSLGCLNPYEFIRKYRCSACNAVMMCFCDREIGTSFLSHQLDKGVVLETQERLAVTLGFQPNVCRECRGLDPESHPLSAAPGRTSKIKRYYWREIAFRQMQLYAEWKNQHPGNESNVESWVTRPDLEQRAVAEIKQLHETRPKYRFGEPSQRDIIEQFAVEVIDLHATYATGTTGKAQIAHGSELYTVEEYVRRHFHGLGYKTIFSESSPLHVLFGVFLWSLIQERDDPRVRTVGVAERSAPTGKKVRPMWFLLPDDFGTPGYGTRRRCSIDDYFSRVLPQTKEDLIQTFDDWIGPSQGLRQYLWAEQENAINAARVMVGLLPPEVLLRILRHLIDSYWSNYCGWPDLLVFRDSEFFFVEVKSSNDKLSEDQKHWIAENHARLMLPFRLVKVHRGNQ